MSWLSDLLTISGKVLASTDFWIGVLASSVVVFIHHRMKLPKLSVRGGGSGSHGLENKERFSSHRLTVENNPRFLGYPINRETVFIKSARIYDPEKKTYEGHNMRWQGAPDNKPFNTEIRVGEHAQLFICGVYQKRVHHYAGETMNNIELSETLVEPGEARKLEIHIHDSLQQRYRIPFKISAEERRNYAGKVQVSIRVKTTFADRLQEFKDGLSSMIRAFTRPSY